MVCSRVTEAGVSKYTETYSGGLALDLVVVNGSLDTAEVLRQVAGKIRRVRSFFRPSVRPSVRPFVRSFVRSFFRSVVRPFGRSVVRSFIRSSVHSFVRPFVRSSVRSIVRSFVRSFGRGFSSLSSAPHLTCKTRTSR